MVTTQPTTTFDVLNGHDFMLLTTYRKNGEDVPTPVWFAREGNKLYVTTQSDSGKVKRIGNNSKVMVEPSTSRGESLGDSAWGQARVLPEAEHDHANRLINKKYGWKKTGFDVMLKVSGRSQKITFLEIEQA